VVVAEYPPRNPGRLAADHHVDLAAIMRRIPARRLLPSFFAGATAHRVIAPSDAHFFARPFSRVAIRYAARADLGTANPKEERGVGPSNFCRRSHM
jgi:hypothetical protein